MQPLPPLALCLTGLLRLPTLRFHLFIQSIPLYTTEVHDHSPHHSHHRHHHHQWPGIRPRRLVPLRDLDDGPGLVQALACPSRIQGGAIRYFLRPKPTCHLRASMDFICPSITLYYDCGCSWCLDNGTGRMIEPLKNCCSQSSQA